MNKHPKKIFVKFKNFIKNILSFIDIFYIFIYIFINFSNINKRFIKNNDCNICGDSNKTIWVYWHQGFKYSPLIVRICVCSIMRNKGNAKVFLLDKENISNFILIPPYILSKVKNNKISLQPFSDYIRVALLSEYGGLWIDSTVFVTKTIPESIFSSNFFSLRSLSKCFWPPAYGKWCGWLQYSKQGFSLCEYAKEVMAEYFKKHNNFPRYVFLDYLYLYFYKHNKSMKKILMNIDISICRHEDAWDLLNNFNKEYNDDVYKIITNNLFLKLSYKYNFDLKKDGKETIYGHFIKENYNKKYFQSLLKSASICVK